MTIAELKGSIFSLIRRISLRSAYSLISACYFAGLTTRC